MFYTFNQNNSGGSFVRDEQAGICEVVIIEADSAQEANDIAETKGIYFDGCHSGYDCPCCGDRWYSKWHDDGDEVPSIYGEPISESNGSMFRKDCFVHYKDGILQHTILRN